MSEKQDYFKSQEFKNWVKISNLWDLIANNYFKLTKQYKKELEYNYNIDCGTDYANYIFNSCEIER